MKHAEYRDGEIIAIWGRSRDWTVEVADDHPDVIALRAKQCEEMLAPSPLESRIAKLEKEVKELKEKARSTRQARTN